MASKEHLKKDLIIDLGDFISRILSELPGLRENKNGTFQADWNAKELQGGLNLVKTLLEKWIPSLEAALSSFTRIIANKFILNERELQDEEKLQQDINAFRNSIEALKSAALTVKNQPICRKIAVIATQGLLTNTLSLAANTTTIFTVKKFPALPDFADLRNEISKAITSHSDHLDPRVSDSIFSPDPINETSKLVNNGGFYNEENLSEGNETVYPRAINPFELERFSIRASLVLTILNFICTDIFQKNDTDFTVEIDTNIDFNFLIELLKRIQAKLCSFNDLIKELQVEKTNFDHFNPSLVTNILRQSCHINRLIRLMETEKISVDEARIQTIQLIECLFSLEAKLPYKRLNKIPEDTSPSITPPRLIGWLGEASPVDYANIDWSTI